MKGKTVVITGANRGIGLDFCRYYKNQGAEVIALCRVASAALNDLQVQVHEQIDVSSDESMQQLVVSMQGIAIDVLINNAGILKNESLDTMNFSTIQEQFIINAMGPLRITKALLKQINAGGKIALITSRMGSIADNSSGGRYGYRMSKAALNAAGVSLAHDLKHQHIAVGIFHPGYVQTEMTNNSGDISPKESANRLAKRIEALNLDNSGTFWHSNGEVLPW